MDVLIFFKGIGLFSNDYVGLTSLSICQATDAKGLTSRDMKQQTPMASPVECRLRTAIRGYICTDNNIASWPNDTNDLAKLVCVLRMK